MAEIRYLQEVVKISQGVANKLRATSFPPAFFAFLHNITNVRPIFFYILDKCYNEIPKIYFFNLYLFVFYLVYNVPGSGGSKPLEMVRGGRRHPLKRSGGGEGGRAPTLKPPLFRNTIYVCLFRVDQCGSHLQQKTTLNI